MMNKYTHHLSVAFVVSLEKFPIISHKNPSPKFDLQSEQGEGCFTVSWNGGRMSLFYLSLLSIAFLVDSGSILNKSLI